MEEAKNSLDRLYNSLQDLVYESEGYIQSEYSDKFHKAMQDDFNTPSALSVLFEMARRINTLKKENNSEESSVLAKELVTLSGILGLLQVKPANYFTQGIDLSEEEIKGYILERNQARDRKDFDLSDKIRDELLEKGIILEDKESGTTWKKS